MSQKEIVRASEIAEYVYCHRAWWLKRVYQVRSSNTIALEKGTAVHETHEQQVSFSIWLRRIALGTLLISLLLIWLQFT